MFQGEVECCRSSGLNVFINVYNTLIDFFVCFTQIVQKYIIVRFIQEFEVFPYSLFFLIQVTYEVQNYFLTLWYSKKHD